MPPSTVVTPKLVHRVVAAAAAAVCGLRSLLVATSFPLVFVSMAMHSKLAVGEGSKEIVAGAVKTFGGRVLDKAVIAAFNAGDWFSCTTITPMLDNAHEQNI